MAELIHIDADRLRSNLKDVRKQIAEAAERAGRNPADVELLAAVKYVSIDDLGKLAEAGVRLLGENRAAELKAKATAYGDAFEWDYIGRLQSRRVPEIAPYVRLIHTVESASAMRQLARVSLRAGAGVLIQVNVAGEHGKGGIAPADLDLLIASAPLPVRGLMTMPPRSIDPEDSRKWFAQLRALASERNLLQLSMGTSQDFTVAVEEGATVVRIGSSLYL